MEALPGAMWGVIGGAVVEAYDLVAVARATRRWPWLALGKPAKKTTRAERWNAFGVWFLATITRIAAGGGVAAAASSQVGGELAAFGLGVAGPLVLERILAAYVNPAPPVGYLGSIPSLTPQVQQVTEKASASQPDPPAIADIVEGRETDAF
jgi:hypothetical protein